jgi:arylsulfatase A-like enzyme
MLAVSQVTPEMQRNLDEYDGAISYVDDRLQELMNELRRRRVMDNTLLIVTADHGEGFGEHGLLTHGTALYYPLIHVPLILYRPGHLSAGLRIKRPVSTKDIPATILELLGASHSQFPGKSLATLWNGQTLPDRWPMPLSELKRDRQLFGISYNGHGEIESIVSWELQLILDPRDGSSLYNWQVDTQARVNLFRSPGYEAVRTELAAELKKSE